MVPGGPLALKIDGRMQLIDPESIDWIEADDDHVRGALQRSRVACRARRYGTLPPVSTRRGSSRFTARPSLGSAAVRELQSWFHGDYVAILHSGAKLRLSRSSPGCGGEPGAI